MRPVKDILIGILVLVSVSVLLALLDGRTEILEGVGGYAFVAGVCAVLLVGVYRGVTEGGAPRWLPLAVGVALALRLGLALSLARALPVIGRETPPQQAGYIFYDAYARDRDAWAFGRSDSSLLQAFTDPSLTDQYGGLQFLSATVYRFLTDGIHRPLLVVLLSATASSLAVVLVWAFASMAFGNMPAAIASWVVALYPDGVLLGASQMREPFLLSAVAAGLYGYGLLRIGRAKKGLVVLALGLLTALPISPPFAVTLILVIGLAAVWEGRLSLKRSALVVGLGIAAGLVGIALVIRAWSSAEFISASGFNVVVEWWRNVSGQWQLTLAAQESAWIDFLFARTPDWMHVPMVVSYGLVRPFLPAALMYDSQGIWRWIEIWRAAGWFFLLPFLLYSLVRWVREDRSRRLVVFLVLIVWASALVASYRGFGDQWDNPRYRTTFLALQAVVTGWGWWHARQRSDPWLARTAAWVAIGTGFFTIWYAGRYQMMVPMDIRIILAGLLVTLFLTLVLFLLWDRRGRSLTRGRPPV